MSKHKEQYFNTFLMLLLLGYSLGAVHAAPPQNPNAEITDESEENFWQEMPSVYEASKYAQKLTKSPPASTSVVTADEIKKYGYRSFGDILASIKGFNSTYDRNYGYIGVRGFGLPTDYNKRVLLLIDGHRFNDSIYDYFDTSENFPLDIDVIERIEIVPGPSASLYGNSAFLGVINVITRRGRDQSGTNVKASYGSNNSYKTSFSAGNRFNNGLEAFVSGSLYNSDGYQRLYFHEFDDPAHNHGSAENIDADQSKKIISTLSYGDFSLQGIYYRRQKEVPTASFGAAFNVGGENTTDQGGYADLKYSHLFTNQLQVNARVSYNSYRYFMNLPTNLGSQANPDLLVNKELSRGQWWRAEASATKLLFDQHKITFGAELQQNFDQFLTNYDRITYKYVQQQNDKWALLLQDEYSILPNLSFSFGARLDYYSVFGTTVNPSAGLVYQPWEQTTFKLVYGTAFRAPNQYELSYVQPYLSKQVGDPLKPENLRTVEWIVEQYFNAHLRLEMDFFDTEITDILLLTDRKSVV